MHPQVKSVLFLILTSVSLIMDRSEARADEPIRRFEIEAVPLVYFTKGYHLSLGYRVNRFRLRASVIDAGTYNAEVSNQDFKRFETPGSYGLFAGYFVWKHLEAYAFLDRHNLKVRQRSTGEERDLRVFTPGVGIGYQFFWTSHFYTQPALHLYNFGSQDTTFSNGQVYKLPQTQLVPVVRVGYAF